MSKGGLTFKAPKELFGIQGKGAILQGIRGAKVNVDRGMQARNGPIEDPFFVTQVVHGEGREKVKITEEAVFFVNRAPDTVG